MRADIMRTVNLAAVGRMDKRDRWGGGRDPSVGVD